MPSFLLIQRYNDAFFMPVNFIIQSENVKARQEESTMKIRKYACIAISAALLMTGCQATPDQDIVANKDVIRPVRMKRASPLMILLP